MGRKKPPVRRAPSIKLRESSSSSQASPVDPYRQTSSLSSSTYTESEDSEENSTEAKAKLKDLLDGIVAVSSKYSVEPEAMNTEQAVGAPVHNTDHPMVPIGNLEDKKPTEPEELTFWRQITDDKTNNVYYWNPKTNKVSWVLPNNGVIADDAPDNPLPEEFTLEPEADNPYAEYYAYYKQYYGKPNSETEAPETEESDSNVQSDAMNKPEPKPKKSKPETEPTTIAGTVIGPTLPSTQSPATEVTRPGVKRKVSPGKEADGLDPASKKVRLKSKASDAKSPLSAQAEQALRFQVSNMADEFTRKLGYLHVTNEGLSDIQLLNIQLQTRLSDWKEGGLKSKFMLSKLKSFAGSLLEYEQSAAPEGWKIVWDSSSCRYQYHNLSTGETTWEYPIQQTEPTDMSSQEESSDNETSPLASLPASSITPSLSDEPSPVIGPRLPIGPYRPPPPAPPMESVPESKTAVEQSTSPPEANTPVATAQVMVGPPGPPPAPPMESQPEYEGPTVEHTTTIVKSHGLRSPSPTSKSDLTLQKVRHKLYPSLRPQRSREPVDVPVLPPPPLPVEVPPVIANNSIDELKPPLANREGVELISEYPPPSEEKSVSDPLSKSSRVFDMGVIKPSIETVPPPAQQSAPESEACIRNRLLERHQIKFTVTPKEKNEESFLVRSHDPANQPKPQNTVDRVELSTGESVQVNVSEIPENSQQTVKDDSRVEPETGAVEALPESIANEMSTSVPKGNEQDSSSRLYQSGTPSPPTEEKEGNNQLPITSPRKEAPEDGEMSSETSADSESASESNEKHIATERCYMDIEEAKEKARSRSSRKSHKHSKHRRDEYYSDSDRDDRYSDVEYSSSRRHKSSKHSRRDYSSDESEERSSRKDKHRRSHRYDNSDDEYSRRRSSRSSHHTSRRNRSRSRSSHRRKRSYSKDSHSPHSSERPKKSPKHKKVKKEKKKKSHKTDRNEKKEEIHAKEEDEAPKTPPNVIVGKVGRISSQRTLGKDKKPEDKPETPKLSTAQPPQAMSASYYQQPTTGEVPYYYYQGYYDPSMYQQWGGQQGQWYGQDGTQTTSGTVQYPIQYPSSSQYAPTTTTAPHPVSTETSQSTTAPETLSIARVQESGEELNQVPSTEATVETDSIDKKELQMTSVSETGEAEPKFEESSQELPVVSAPQAPVEEPNSVQAASCETVLVDKEMPAAFVVVPSMSASPPKEPVTVESQITECDMDIDDNTPSPQALLPQEPTIENEPLRVSTDVPPTCVEVSIGQEDNTPPPVPPMMPEHPQPPHESSSVVAPPPTGNNLPSDEANSTIEPFSGETTSPSGTPPIPAMPTTAEATATPTSADYSSYMLANQQQQAYSYAYATNNYVQAAYNAYVQQASAAYQAYGAAGYYPGYGTQQPTASYGASYYGATTTDPTTPTSGGYGKVAYQLAQQAANTSTSDSSDAKKSEFALAGNKSKQMKNMMDKWSSFKDKEDSN